MRLHQTRLPEPSEPKQHADSDSDSDSNDDFIRRAERIIDPKSAGKDSHFFSEDEDEDQGHKTVRQTGGSAGGLKIRYPAASTSRASAATSRASVEKILADFTSEHSAGLDGTFDVSLDLNARELIEELEKCEITVLQKALDTLSEKELSG